MISFRLPSLPFGLAYDHKSGFVFVTQPDVHNVIAVNVTMGAVVLTIGKGRGNQFGQLNTPYGIALDGYSHLLVADNQNYRIAVFNASDGTPITSLHTPPTPHSVFGDKNGSVVVGCDNGLLMWS